MAEEYEMSREEKVITYVCGLCESLVERGFLEGGRYKLAGQGKENYKKLIEQGFVPTEEEIKCAMEALQNH